ncbi:hypothetical protein MLD38_022880 [Melastoma candidum]|uniref:Uncharacterized protein n=1 Tax=Melastoma candidum TaxID=119954 RepID=A0ACB9QK26_9MYRT|nr:hypothetical protein MLD38_022880 [Melastoma candidum]
MQLRTSGCSSWCNSGFSRDGSRFRCGSHGRSSKIKNFRFKVVGKSSSGDRWKLSDIDTSAVQERVNSWLSRTQNFLNEVAVPLMKTGQNMKSDSEETTHSLDMGEILVGEWTLNRRTQNGILSWEAVVAIEQFSRMNGLTGKKMQKIFKALVPESLHGNARTLVEYCCFRFLSRDSSYIHPRLEEPAFQMLVFLAMLAWQNPYCEADKDATAEKLSFEGKLVREEAFIRIAPSVSGVADYSTVHNLFKALAVGDGISLNTWLTYINEIIKVHQGRSSYQIQEISDLSQEKVLCLGSGRKRPVLKWENNMAWPGKVTLTDKAVYFEAIGLLGRRDVARLDLTKKGLRIEKAKVGPMGSVLFDSAVSISAGPELEKWLLEFVDFGGDMRRDVWYAFLSEVVALHKFIHDYGPEPGDESMFHVYGAHKGRERATMSAINSISRLQALQLMRKLLDDPIKLVQFSYLQRAPHGSIVCEAMAVKFWGGPLLRRYSEPGYETDQERSSADEILDNANHVFDIDGSIFLNKWMRSSSWYTNLSMNFWRNSSVRRGLVLSKSHVVGDESLVERAAKLCKQKSQIVEITQATIDAATLEGIPNNIDLFKEIILPLTSAIRSFQRLRRWEDPRHTTIFLGLTYTLIFRNLLSYIFPATLIMVAVSMLTLNGLKQQGRLGRFFGRVTIRDQPPSNTIQKIIAVKDAMRDVESYLQNINVVLLKIRSILLAGHPQVTTEVALVLLTSAVSLLLVPFKYILSCLIFDAFTRELEFRREMVQRFRAFLKERWEMVPAASVVVLPYVSGSPRQLKEGISANKEAKSENKPDPQ